MTTAQLRAVLKAADPSTRVSSRGEGVWTVRVRDNVEVIQAHLRTLGLDEIDHDVEGPSNDWIHVLVVAQKEAP